MKSVSDIFSEQGVLVDLIDDFKHRPEQEVMAQTIYDTVIKGNDLVCEAGTGTGKTIGYLIPALMTGQKTIVSTGTKHLQDQLNQKDLPVVLDALKLPITTAVLKGRANYLCLERMEAALNDTKDLSFQQITDLQEIVNWSSSTASGDINELDMIQENNSVQGLITSTIDNCLGQNCPHFDNCHVFKNRKAALEADLVITNHHLLLADMTLRETGFGEVLPLADIIIFDEAHQLPGLASSYFSQTLSSRQLLELLSDTRTANHKEAGDIQELPSMLEHMEKAIRDIRLIFGRKDRRLIWQDIWNDGVLPVELPRFLEIFQSLLDILEPASERGNLLANCLQRTKQHYDFIETLTENKREDLIRWVEVKGHHFYLNQTPVNIAESFQQRLSTYHASTIFTSASLAVNDDFSHFSQQLGLADIKQCILESPFDFQKQTTLYIPLDLPEPAQSGFFDSFIQRAIDLLAFSDGHAFILFTSHQSLNKASDILGNKLEYPLFIQGKAPRSELLNKFRQTKHAVLLGTNSFWEGVDVKGEALSLVIIEKLPFASPDDPVLQARLNYLSKKGINPFMEYQVPQAAIILKQGVGRLIRDVADRGVCAICDKRIISKAYGKRILSGLPDMPISHEIKDVEKFFGNAIAN
ncbi:MAG: ATP-dependent DNA helicase [Proteobacteria bacterium]|nr:ATP-dependent DNA helicase [Pseudomonadota bacterium]